MKIIILITTIILGQLSLVTYNKQIIFLQHGSLRVFGEYNFSNTLRGIATLKESKKIITSFIGITGTSKTINQLSHSMITMNQDRV